MRLAIVIFFALCLVAVFGVMAALAHDAARSVAMPQGWSYPSKCCAGYDCRRVNVPESEVQITADGGGYRISTTGEFVGQMDRRVHDSPDGMWHWCSQGGRDDGSTLCIFRPPPLF